MNVRQAYDKWAEQYDANQNKTRDLEGTSLRETISGFHFERVLEIGCGTGKNTLWLQTISDNLLCVDFSEQMLAVAKTKVVSETVTFIQADISKEWNFSTTLFDLVTFSLVLEHVDDLIPIFQKAGRVLKPGGKIYIGELHPFKQYTGTKARFETEQGTQTVTCYTHHLSDFAKAAKEAGFAIDLINEYFDDSNKAGIPRILTLLLSKHGPDKTAA